MVAARKCWIIPHQLLGTRSKSLLAHMVLKKAGEKQLGFALNNLPGLGCISGIECFAKPFVSIER